MNIVFITKLSGNMWAGPNNSVPAQIASQSKIDNVFWYNLNYVNKFEWEQLPYYKNLKDFPEKRVENLPPPFNKPDLIIFEGVYEYPFNMIVFEIWQKKIPYIIVPRSALTRKAQKSSFLKKQVANFFYFKKFINKALAIHFLTEKEYHESQKYINTNHFILPNGIEYKTVRKQDMQGDSIKGIFIGRIEIYQKGLDLLVEACSLVQDELRNIKCTINLYGPDRNNSKAKLNKMITERNLADIIQINEGVFDEEKERIYVSSDFFIMTSRFEGHPMGLIEALSYGIPSLVTDGTNMKNEIVRENAGWGAELTIESIAKALTKLVSNKKEIPLKGKNAKKLSHSYDWDNLAKIAHSYYLDLLKGEKYIEK